MTPDQMADAGGRDCAERYMLDGMTFQDARARFRNDTSRLAIGMAGHFDPEVILATLAVMRAAFVERWAELERAIPAHCRQRAPA